MAATVRHVIKSIKEKVPLSPFQANGRDKVDNLLTRFVSAVKLNGRVEKLKYETVTNKVKEMIFKYEKFTGVAEILGIQNTVIEAQEKFMAAQDRRREVSRQVANLESRLKELHSEIQNTMKGDDNYLHLCTEEHKLIIQERALRALFSDAEREERELFATMSAAVKLGHEKERAHAERNKYWYIIASIFGTVLGIAGSTVNNHLKMLEFREMIEQQVARSASVLYTIAGGGTASKADITEAMETEFAYQEQLGQGIKEIQENIDDLMSKQVSLIEHLHRREHSMDVLLGELRRTIVTASQSSAKSDAELAKALTAVYQELEEVDKMELRDESLLEPNKILTGVGVIICLAMIFGNIIGRIS